MTQLLDHLIGKGEHLIWHLQAKRPRGFEVDHQLKPGGLRHRQVGGLGALEDAAGIDAGLTRCVQERTRVADQTPGSDDLTNCIHGRKPMPRRQRNNRRPQLVIEVRIGGDEQGTGSLDCERGECGVKIAFAADLDEVQPQPQSIRSFAQISDLRVGIGAGVWIYEHADGRRLGKEFMQQLELPRGELRSVGGRSRYVATRPGQAGDQPDLNRIG
jgi:hypothetical protein